MNILMLLSNPFTNDARVYNEASSLIQAGHKITVIAWDRAKNNTKSQTLAGINVARVRTCLPARWGLASWPWHFFHLLSWEWQAYRQALKINKKIPFDVIHCHDLDTLSAGVALKHKLGLPLIYDAHEIYGYMAAGVVPQWVGHTLLEVERSLVRRADAVITVSEAVRRYLGSITDHPISVVMNCKQLPELEYKVPSRQDTFTILYIGLLDKTRSLFQLINAVGALSNVRCLIGGFGRPDFIEDIRNECARRKNITFLGLVPLEEVLPITAKSDCIFLMLDPGHPYAGIALGNKQFEAMACGRPIICTRGTYSGELTEQENVGLAIDYSEEVLKQAIIKLRDDPKLREKMGRNALRAARTKYNWKAQEKVLLKLYKDIRQSRD